MMSGRRNQRSGVEDRWYRTVVEINPDTGRTLKRKDKSPERYGKGNRWRARYVDPNGVERSRSFATKVDAQRFLDSDVTAKVVTGSWVDPDRSGVLFEVVAERWFATKQLKKPKTVAGYRSLLDRLVLPRWGKLTLRDIEFEDVQTWVVELMESGSHRFKGRGLSPSRTIQAYQVLDQVLRFAIRAKRLVVNPADDIDLPSKSPAEKRFLTHAQVLRLALASGRFRILVFVLAYTGIRFGEAIALQVGDVDLTRHRIIVSRSATRVAGQGVVETDTKNHTKRSVPLPSFLVTELASLLEGGELSALVFTGRDGGRLSLGEFRWAFDQAREAVKLYGVVPHGLRHTAASLAISSGANVKVVQKMLGHKTATLTLDLYGHLFDDDLGPVADAMNRGAIAAADALRTERGQSPEGGDDDGILPAVS